MPTAQSPNGMARIRPAWIIWAITSFAFASYISMAYIASEVTTARLQLNSANEVQVKLFRLFDDTLEFRLTFQSNGREQRPELGSFVSYNKKDGLRNFQPGADVHILVSVSSSSPLRYEALPLVDLYRRDQNIRWMTTNYSIQPGVYRWPPPPLTPVTHLHVGFNVVRFEVASVGEPLIGESVSLFVSPPLGSKESRASVAWLWFGLWWPVFLVAQVLWAACLCHGGLRRREAPT